MLTHQHKQITVVYYSLAVNLAHNPGELPDQYVATATDFNVAIDSMAVFLDRQTAILQLRLSEVSVCRAKLEMTRAEYVRESQVVEDETNPFMGNNVTERSALLKSNPVLADKLYKRSGLTTYFEEYDPKKHTPITKRPVALL